MLRTVGFVRVLPLINFEKTVAAFNDILFFNTVSNFVECLDESRDNHGTINLLLGIKMSA